MPETDRTGKLHRLDGEVRRLRDEGHTTRQIASQLGLSQSKVSRILRRKNVRDDKHLAESAESPAHPAESVRQLTHQSDSPGSLTVTHPVPPGMSDDADMIQVVATGPLADPGQICAPRGTLVRPVYQSGPGNPTRLGEPEPREPRLDEHGHEVFRHQRLTTLPENRLGFIRYVLVEEASCPS